MKRWLTMGKTSAAAKNRYNDKVYKKIIVALKKDFVEEWEEQLKTDGITKASFIREAISKYMCEAKERGKGHE
jgi:metal-responsive CopG/Arc/MetJ family transcriptional regulator